MFTGEYNHTIDAKGRLIIPNKFRTLLGENFYITKGLDGCLTIYDSKRWEELERKISELPMTNTKARDFKRFLVGSCRECIPDKMGRILVPASLRKYANLDTNENEKDKDVIVVGVGDNIEVWESSLYSKKSEIEDYDKLALDLEGLGI